MVWELGVKTKNHEAGPNKILSINIHTLQGTEARGHDLAGIFLGNRQRRPSLPTRSQAQTQSQLTGLTFLAK